MSNEICLPTEPVCLPEDALHAPIDSVEGPELVPTEEDAPYPRCHIGENIYVDLDLSGSFSVESDMVVGPNQTRLPQDEAEAELEQIGYDPDFAGCFYNSAPSMFSSLAQLRTKHGDWPSHITVLTSSHGSEPVMGIDFLRTLGDRLSTAQNPEDSRNVILEFRRGIRFEPTGFNITRLGMRKFPYHSTGRIGQVDSWLYDPKTVGRAASRRFLVVISMSFNSFGRVTANEYGNALDDFVADIRSKYKLPQDHVTWVDPRFGWQTPHVEDIKATLEKITDKLPADTRAEVMVVYANHGYPSEQSHGQWGTSYVGFGDEYLDENRFRALLLDNLPPDKVSSALIIIHACHSGMLVE